MLPGSREWRKALRSDQEVRWRVKNRRGGAPGGARAGHTARGRLREVPSCYQRRFGAPLPHANEGRSEGAGPAPTNEGAMNHALWAESCLKSESEIKARSCGEHLSPRGT